MVPWQIPRWSHRTPIGENRANVVLFALCLLFFSVLQAYALSVQDMDNFFLQYPDRYRNTEAMTLCEWPLTLRLFNGDVLVVQFKAVLPSEKGEASIITCHIRFLLHPTQYWPFFRSRIFAKIYRCCFLCVTSSLYYRESSLAPLPRTWGYVTEVPCQVIWKSKQCYIITLG